MPSTKITPAPLTRTLSAIAREIRTSDAPSKGWYYAAAPYVGALGQLSGFSDRYGHDDAEDIVIRLLGNLSNWRGETATRVKAELKAALADHAAKRVAR